MATYNPKRKINSAGTLEEINFRAKYDGDGNEIVATYATKEELGQTESVANSAAQEASSAANEASSASSLANEAKTAADGASSQVASMQTEVSDLNSRVTALENGGGGGGSNENLEVIWQSFGQAMGDIPLSMFTPEKPGKNVCLIHAIAGYGSNVTIKKDGSIVESNICEAKFSITNGNICTSILITKLESGSYLVQNKVFTDSPTISSITVAVTGIYLNNVTGLFYYV